MKEELKLLVELQEIDSVIVKRANLIAAIPQKISSVEQPLKEAQLRFDRQKQKCDALEKTKKGLERSVEDVNEKIRKLKTRTTEIKTNREYQAHLKEIESAEKELSAKEDEILALMESMDSVFKELKAEEARLKAEKEKVEAFRKKLNEEVEIAEREIGELKQKRAGLVKQVDKETYKVYFGILGGKGGLAVVEAREEVCQGCYMNIPPQLFVELKRNERIVLCPQCGRILYWKGDAARPLGPSAVASE